MKKAELLSRWNGNRNLVNTVNTESYGYFNNRKDLRGFSVGEEWHRISLDKMTFESFDFSYASFLSCFFTQLEFIDCIFEGAIFNQLNQHNSKYQNCVFAKTEFINAHMGISTVFENCEFYGCKLKGKYFSFGLQNMFENCVFENCDVRSAWIRSDTFRNCIFSSKFQSVRFSGFEVRHYEDHQEYPATFIDCDFSRSFFKGFEIMDGVRLTNTKFPELSFRTDIPGRKYIE